MSAKEIERFLYNECGLKGLSGISNVVRDLLKSQDPGHNRALGYFVYRIALSAGMLASAMGGIDGFVFTAGIGENAPSIREAVASRLRMQMRRAQRGFRAKVRELLATSSRPMRN